MWRLCDSAKHGERVQAMVARSQACRRLLLEPMLHAFTCSSTRHTDQGAYQTTPFAWGCFPFYTADTRFNIDSSNL